MDNTLQKYLLEMCDKVAMTLIVSLSDYSVFLYNTKRNFLTVRDDIQKETNEYMDKHGSFGMHVDINSINLYSRIGNSTLWEWAKHMDKITKRDKSREFFTKYKSEFYRTFGKSIFMKDMKENKIYIVHSVLGAAYECTEETFRHYHYISMEIPFDIYSSLHSQQQNYGLSCKLNRAKVERAINEGHTCLSLFNDAVLTYCLERETISTIYKDYHLIKPLYDKWYSRDIAEGYYNPANDNIDVFLSLEINDHYFDEKNARLPYDQIVEEVKDDFERYKMVRYYRWLHNHGFCGALCEPHSISFIAQRYDVTADDIRHRDYDYIVWELFQHKDEES